MSDDVKSLFAAHLAEIRRLDAKLAAVKKIVFDFVLNDHDDTDAARRIAIDDLTAELSS